MLYYLDTMIVVYAVEGTPANQQRALKHLAGLESAGHDFAISDFTLTECLVPHLAPNHSLQLSEFYQFFHGPGLRTISLTAAMYTRAAAIRGTHAYPANSAAKPRRIGLADAIHLSVAIESGCHVFLTNDSRLANFQGITVELLP